jgi:hypothetical protein
MHKENEDYIHVTLKEEKLDLSKTLSERMVDHNNPFMTARESNVIKLRRLDKFQLDEYGNRKPTNLTEFLFGDQTADYVLSRDHNLKCYVEYKEIVRVFSKILMPLCKSHESLKRQFEELIKFKEIRDAIRYNSNLKEGIGELKLFMVNASEARLDEEFEFIEESFMKTKSMIYPT